MTIQELKQLIYKGEKVDVECKEAESRVPASAYESYSSFANTKGGYIVLGVKEDKKKKSPEERFIIQGIKNTKAQVEDFWNTINNNKVNVSILKDEDVFTVEEGEISLIVIKVPRADYKCRPVYIGDNPYKGTFKRNNEGDYHATQDEVKAMIRDSNPEGNDGMILEYFTMDDIDKDTLRRYRQVFKVANDGHVWNELDDKAFLEKLGGYRKDRREGKEGLTLAGLLMFGDGLAIRNEFSNIFMDYRDESAATPEIRWNDRITYDGTWENNLFNFFSKVTPKITSDLPKPFKLEGNMRVDDTPLHKAVREAFVNLIIHSDYLMDAGTLKIIKRADGFEFTNPGILKLPIEDIYQGGNSKPRNPLMQTMLRMVGFGDNAGSGFPTILSVWKENDWVMPELREDTTLNQVTLTLRMTPPWAKQLQLLRQTIIENTGESLSQFAQISKTLVASIDATMGGKYENTITAIGAVVKRLSETLPKDQIQNLTKISEKIVDFMPENVEVVEAARALGDSLKIVADKMNLDKRLSDNEKQAIKTSDKKQPIKTTDKKQPIKTTDKTANNRKKVIGYLEVREEAKTKDIAEMLGLSNDWTRALLREMVCEGLIEAHGENRNRTYSAKK